MRKRFWLLVGAKISGSHWLEILSAPLTWQVSTFVTRVKASPCGAFTDPLPTTPLKPENQAPTIRPVTIFSFFSLFFEIFLFIFFLHFFSKYLRSLRTPMEESHRTAASPGYGNPASSPSCTNEFTGSTSDASFLTAENFRDALHHTANARLVILFLNLFALIS